MSAPRGRVAAAFAAIYLIWGSTYLFMRFAGETIPPLGVAGLRFFAAGSVFWLLSLRTPVPRIAGFPWRGHALVGILLATGNAAITWSVQRIPSGVASLLVGLTPCWMVLLEWRRHPAHRPGAGVIAGLALGVAGTLVLVGPHSLGGAPIEPIGTLVVIGGTVAWATGSIYVRTLPRFPSATRTNAVQMVSGGAVVLLAAAATGQFAGFSVAAASPRSLAALVYLILFGSLLGFSAYMYLLGVTSAARVSTYAFVNPAVAVVLGALFAGEALSPRVLLAAVLIVGAVAMITFFGAEEEERAPPLAVPEATLEVHEAP
jgi:drug/metabolite transporter (DMT)-like permease